MSGTIPSLAERRAAAVLRHPAGKGREPRFACIICDGPIGCDCIASLLDGYQRPLTETDVRSIVRDEVDECLREFGEAAMRSRS